MRILERTVRTNKDFLLIAHLLRRAGFGVTPKEMDRYRHMSYEDIVETLLNPNARPMTMSTDVTFIASSPSTMHLWGMTLVPIGLSG